MAETSPNAILSTAERTEARARADALGSVYGSEYRLALHYERRAAALHTSARAAERYAKIFAKQARTGIRLCLCHGKPVHQYDVTPCPNEEDFSLENR